MATRTSSQAGNWSNTATWGGAAKPGNNDLAVIGHAVTVDENTTVGISPPQTPNTILTHSPTAGATPTNLPTGTYRFRYSNVDSGGGESTTSPSTGNLSLTNGVSTPRVTLPTLPTGVTSRKLYMTDTGGAAGTEKLYATGITGTTYDPVSASWTDGTTTYAAAAAQPNNAAIQVNSGGTVTISGGFTLTARGDIRLSNVTITLNDGAILEFDASAAVSAANTPYKLWVGTASGHSSAKLLCNGTAGTGCIVRSNSGGANASIDVLVDASAGFATNCGQGTCAYTTFTRLGTSTRRRWNTSFLSGTLTLELTNCTFDACGTIYWNFGTPDTSHLTITDCIFQNSVDSTNGNLRMLANAPTTGARIFRRNHFDQVIPLIAHAGATWEDNVFMEGFIVGAGISTKWTSFARNLIRKSTGTGSQLVTAGDSDDCYWFWNADANNPHFTQPDSGIASLDDLCEYSGNIFEYTGPVPDPPSDWGDGVFGINGVEITIRNCIVLPNGKSSPRNNSCTLFTIFGAVTGTIKAYHNTYFTGNQSCHISEAGLCTAGRVPEFKSNLAWCDSGEAYSGTFGTGKANSVATPSTDTADVFTPGGTDYNAMLNGTTGFSGGGYNIKLTGTYGVNFGANDVDLTGASSTLFVDDTRNFAKWAVSRGSASGTVAGQITDGLGYLKADRTLIASSLIPYVRDGFAPKNLSLKDAGHDGITIGAVEMASTVIAARRLEIRIGQLAMIRGA